MSTTKGLTNALLKSKMTDAMVDRGLCVNLDTLRSPGVYYLNGDTICANPPAFQYWRYGIIEVFVRYGLTFHRISCQDGVAQRMINNGAVQPWIILGSA